MTPDASLETFCVDETRATVDRIRDGVGLEGSRTSTPVEPLTQGLESQGTAFERVKHLHQFQLSTEVLTILIFWSWQVFVSNISSDLDD